VEIHRPPPKRKTFLTPVTTEKDQRKPRRRKSPGEPKGKAKEASGGALNESNERDVSQRHMWKRADEPHRTDDDGIAFVGEAQAAAAAARDTTKIKIPFADTPVINRNKQLRQQHGQGHRRSSVGLRGRRASSLIESGSAGITPRIASYWMGCQMANMTDMVIAVPHTEVDVKDFYKHISEEGLSEPRRMKQLLTWCGTRALGEKPSYSSGDGNAKLAGETFLTPRSQTVTADIGAKLGSSRKSC
jgi:kinetochore protein Mis13/DSN1